MMESATYLLNDQLIIHYCAQNLLDKKKLLWRTTIFKHQLRNQIAEP